LKRFQRLYWKKSTFKLRKALHTTGVLNRKPIKR